MQFPVAMEFKLAALTPQITMSDASGQTIFYVKQKMFKLKESINVFADVEQTHQLYQINADRVVDFSARYRFTNMSGQELGSVKRQGRASLWKARYDILEGENQIGTISEKNPWMKVGDSLFGEIPVVGLLSGYVFNPTYQVMGPDGQAIVEVKKEPSFTGRRFTITAMQDVPEANQHRLLLAILMMTLRERSRG